MNGGIALKKILLLMCLLVALSGVASAEIYSGIDDFDKTKYIFSHFKETIIKDKGLNMQYLTFRKKITANNVEYTLRFNNVVTTGNTISMQYDFLIKFDNNDNEIYILPDKQNDLLVLLDIPENVVNKILSSNKITLRIPFGPQYLRDNKTGFRNVIVDIPENIANEWRQVIQAE